MKTKNITWSAEIDEHAQRLAHERGFNGDVGAFLAHLVKEARELRQRLTDEGPLEIKSVIVEGEPRRALEAISFVSGKSLAEVTASELSAVAHHADNPGEILYDVAALSDDPEFLRACRPRFEEWLRVTGKKFPAELIDRAIAEAESGTALA